MQTKTTLIVTLLVTTIIIFNNYESFAQRNPSSKGSDDRLEKRIPGKTGSQRPRGDEKIQKQRPEQTVIPKEKNKIPFENEPPQNPHPEFPEYYPEHPVCYDPPPARPNPHRPKTPEIIIDYKDSGIENFKEGEYDIALEYLTIAVESDSEDYELFYYKGVTEIKLLLYEEALKDLDYYLEYIIYEPDGYFQRGLAKFYLDEKFDAKADFEIAAEMDHKLAISILKRFY